MADDGCYPDPGGRYAQRLLLDDRWTQRVRTEDGTEISEPAEAPPSMRPVPAAQ